MFDIEMSSICIEQLKAFIMLSPSIIISLFMQFRLSKVFGKFQVNIIIGST